MSWLGVGRDRNYELGVDLGTSNVLMHSIREGLRVEQSATIGVRGAQARGGIVDARVVAVGDDARRMRGRCGESVVIENPMSQGVVKDADLAIAMLRRLFARGAAPSERRRLGPSRNVLISVPFGATPSERDAFRVTAASIGRDVALVDEPLAAAVGSGLPVLSCSGRLVLDVGAGITEAVVITMGQIATGHSIRVGGDDFDQRVQQFVRRHHDFLISVDEAERLKREGVDLLERGGERAVSTHGFCLRSRSPGRIDIDSTELARAVEPLVDEIARLLVRTMEATSPELLSDVADEGVHLTGGASLLPGLRERLSAFVDMPVHLVRDPMHAVVLGNSLIGSDRELRHACLRSA